MYRIKNNYVNVYVNICKARCMYINPIDKIPKQNARL